MHFFFASPQKSPTNLSSRRKYYAASDEIKVLNELLPVILQFLHQLVVIMSVQVRFHRRDKVVVFFFAEYTLMCFLVVIEIDTIIAFASVQFSAVFTAQPYPMDTDHVRQIDIDDKFSAMVRNVCFSIYVIDE